MGEETIQQVLEELRAERDKLDRAIQALEGAGSGVSTNGRQAARRPGRRTMSVAQRKAVGERMKKYWAARRAEKAKARPAKSAKVARGRLNGRKAA